MKEMPEEKYIERTIPYWDAVWIAFRELQEEDSEFEPRTFTEEEFREYWEWALDNEDREKVRRVRVRLLMNQFPGLPEDKAEFYIKHPDFLLWHRMTDKVFEGVKDYRGRRKIDWEKKYLDTGRSAAYSRVGGAQCRKQ
jgi:hypothetical protein